MNWLTRFSESRRQTGPFGPLEWRVLSACWQNAHEVSVRDLQPLFPDIAYTTLMTTLDRLHRKHMLDRTKMGRAFYYRPRMTKSEFEAGQAAEALRVALSGDAGTVGPLLSYFVEAVGDRDRVLLDELAALVQSRQAEIGKKGS